MAVTHQDPIEAIAEEIHRQIAQAAQQPGPESNEWNAGYAKGVKIARRIAQQRGYKVPATQ